MNDDELRKFGLDGSERREAAPSSLGEVDYAEMETRVLAVTSHEVMEMIGAGGLPDASMVPVGATVFNRETNELMTSDGTSWYSHSSTGRFTSPPRIAAKDAVELLDRWRAKWPIATDYIDKVKRLQNETRDLLKDLKRKP